MKYSINTALIMAAGRGMRMMPLTTIIPKAMVPYNGSTLIANGIDKIKKRVDNIYVTVGYKGALLAQHVIEHNVGAVFNTDGKDNAWWIFNTLLKFVDEPVLVLTCDNVTELDVDLIGDEYNQFGQPACMVVPVKPIKGLDGDYIFHDNNVISKLSRHEPSDIYCSGIQVLNPAKINQLIAPADNFYDVWERLMKQQQLYCSHTYPSKWFAVDTMDQLQQLPQSQSI